MANAVVEKIQELDVIDKDLVVVSKYITSQMGMTDMFIAHISIIWDGWLTKHCHTFSSFVIQYIYSPLENSSLWSIKSHLLAFNQTVGHHTRQVIGQELVDSIKKFQFKDQVHCICHLL